MIFTNIFLATLQEKTASFRPGKVMKVSFLRKYMLQHATLTLKNRFTRKELLTTDVDRILNKRQSNAFL